MKLNCLFFISLFAFLFTGSFSFNFKPQFFTVLPVSAQEINDSPQSLEDAEKIRSRLPQIRAGSGAILQWDRSHPKYIGTILSAMEDLEEKVLPIYKKYGKREEENVIISQLCDYSLEVGHLVNIEEKTFNYCRHEEVYYISIGSLVEQYKNLGKYTEATNALYKQIDSLKEGLANETYAKSPEEWVEIAFKFRREVTLNDIGNLYLMLGNITHSQEHYSLALQYFQESRDYLHKFLNEELLANNYIQNLYKDEWNYENGLQLYNQGYYGNIGLVLLATGKIDEAEENLRKALDYDYNTYSELQKLLIKQKRYEEVLEISENTLASSIGRNKLPELTIDQIRNFAIEKNTTIVKYLLFDKQHWDYTLRRSGISVLVIKSNGEIHFRQVDATNPSSNQPYSNLKPIFFIATLIVLVIGAYFFIQNKKKIALIALVLSGAFPLLIFLTNRQNQIDSLSNTTTPSNGLFLSQLIYTTLDKFRDTNKSLKLIEENSCQDKDTCLRKLNQILIQPIADLLPQKPEEHVVFIPQEYLSKVPFAALKDEKGKYLIEKHTIHIASSIRLLQFTNQLVQQKSSTSTTQALIVGNPTMPQVPIDIDPRTMEGVKGTLDPLPGTEEEAKEIARLWQTQPLIGEQATELAFVQQLSEANIIHLATHGLYLINGSSFLVLAPSRQYDNDPSYTIGYTKKPDDGILSPEEIENLDLKAELVVLSACDTALSPIMSDIGFAQPFLAKGVPSVVVSLWEVPDAPTSELMVDFYKNLKSNPDKAQALRQAMLTTMKKHPDPVNWAAFTLVGEAQ